MRPLPLAVVLEGPKRDKVGGNHCRDIEILMGSDSLLIYVENVHNFFGFFDILPLLYIIHRVIDPGSLTTHSHTYCTSHRICIVYTTCARAQCMRASCDCMCGIFVRRGGLAASPNSRKVTESSMA